jgi:Fe2+ or Zn2+ uptake regulation protein
VDSTRSLFIRHGLRCTSQRTALYEALRATKRHPTAEELYHEVKPRTSSLSLATVYSTLDAFCRVGLAQRIPTADGGCRFDADTNEHVHLWLEGSGVIRDLPPDLSRRVLESIPPDLLRAIEQRLGVRVAGMDIHLVGGSTPDETARVERRAPTAAN